MSQDLVIQNKKLQGEKLVAAHSIAFDMVINENEALQESVDDLGKELD